MTDWLSQCLGKIIYLELSYFGATMKNFKFTSCTSLYDIMTSYIFVSWFLTCVTSFTTFKFVYSTKNVGLLTIFKIMSFRMHDQWYDHLKVFMFKIGLAYYIIYLFNVNLLTTFNSRTWFYRTKYYGVTLFKNLKMYIFS